MAKRKSARSSTAETPSKGKKAPSPTTSPARGKAAGTAAAKATTPARATRSAAPASSPAPTKGRATRVSKSDKDETKAPPAKKQKADKKKEEANRKKGKKEEEVEVEEKVEEEQSKDSEKAPEPAATSSPAPAVTSPARVVSNLPVAASPTIASPPRVQMHPPQAPLVANMNMYPTMNPMIPGSPAGMQMPPSGQQGGVAYTDQDILLPITNEQIAGRAANREYIQLLQANCAMYHSLPSNEQIWMLNNVCHFLTVVRERRLLHFHPWGGWRILTEPLPFIVAELNLDTFKRAAFRFHPLWLLGDHDPSGYHKGTPFVHRKVTGAWKRASVEDVRMILQGEGLKNLLLLPTGMEFDEEAESEPKKEEEKAE